MRIFAVGAEDAIGAQLAACLQNRPGHGSGTSARGLTAVARPGTA